MELRERRSSDLAQLVAVVRRVRDTDGYPAYLPHDDCERFLTRPEPVAAWVAVTDDNSIVGHVALNPSTSRNVVELVGQLHSEPALYVARLLVDPSGRRSGIGRRLLERARQHAADVGCLPMLDVLATPGAAPAIALYRAQGWREIGRVPFEPVGVDELVFRGPA